MNLRQKAKKYKEKCKMLEAMIIPARKTFYNELQYNIVTLRAEQMININEMSAVKSCYMDSVNRDLAMSLLRDILNYSDIRVIFDKNRDEAIGVSLTIKVVDMRGVMKNEID